MELPPTLVDSISALLAKFEMKKIQKAAQELSLRYREKQNKNIKFIQSKEEAIAYLCMRFPATFAANYKVYSQLASCVDVASIHSLLDLGSGSGASVFAALEMLPSLEKVECVEQDAFLIDLGKNLLKESKSKIKNSWTCDSFTNPSQAQPADLVVFSYSLGEAPKNSYHEIFDHVLPLVKNYLVIIEPGTPVGFERILHARDYLIEKQMHLVAPCPHNKVCPMNKTFKWCHFSQRLPRTTFHKYLKDAALGYEDEKYSYVVFSKLESPTSGDRIVGKPKVSSGFAEFEICSQQGSLEHAKILKRDVDNFGSIKKLEWGDTLD